MPSVMYILCASVFGAYWRSPGMLKRFEGSGSGHVIGSADVRDLKTHQVDGALKPWTVHEL